MNNRLRFYTVALAVFTVIVFGLLLVSIAGANTESGTPAHVINGGHWECQRLPIVAAGILPSQHERPFDPGTGEPNSTQHTPGVGADELCNVDVPVAECDPFHEFDCDQRCEWNEQWQRWVNCGLSVEGTPVPLPTPTPDPEDPHEPFCSPLWEDDGEDEDEYVCCDWNAEAEVWECTEYEDGEKPDWPIQRLTQAAFTNKVQ